MPLINISHSKLRKITTCMYQYKLYYLDGWRRKQNKAIYAFGHTCHEVVTQSLKDRFRNDPAKMFATKWLESLNNNLYYNKSDSFDNFMDLGKALCKKIPGSLKGITSISDIENKFEAEFSGIRFNGYIDFICKYRRKKTILDIKTLKSVSPYEVDMSEQLTLYSMAKGIPHVGIIAMIKTKSDPRIMIYTGTKTKEDCIDLQRKIIKAVEDISRRYYPKASDKMTCQMCDFIPICFGTKSEVKVKLKQIDVRYHAKSIQQWRKRKIRQHSQN